MGHPRTLVSLFQRQELRLTNTCTGMLPPCLRSRLHMSPCHDILTTVVSMQLNCKTRVVPHTQHMLMSTRNTYSVRCVAHSLILSVRCDDP
jgi:hypothetical protein